MLADLATRFLDSWLPKNMPYGQLRAHRRSQNQVDLAPAEPATLYGAGMELGRRKSRQEHCFGVTEFKHRHVITAILLKVGCFVLNWN